MLQALKDLLAELTGGGKTPARFDANDYRLATAALLIHVTTIDGTTSDAEWAKLRTLLRERFALDEATTEELLEAAVAADRDAVDLYGFTSLIGRELDDEGRKHVIEMMWQVVFTDGKVNEFEDNLIWRAADLLGVSSRDRIAARRRVAGDGGEPVESQ